MSSPPHKHEKTGTTSSLRKKQSQPQQYINPPRFQMQQNTGGFQGSLNHQSQSFIPKTHYYQEFNQWPNDLQQHHQHPQQYQQSQRSTTSNFNTNIHQYNPLRGGTKLYKRQDDSNEYVDSEKSDDNNQYQSLRSTVQLSSPSYYPAQTTPLRMIQKKKKHQKKEPKTKNDSSLYHDTFSLSQQSVSQVHNVSANCLRKCGTWSLTVQDGKEKAVCGQIESNSGVALWQMNYEKHQNLSRDEASERRKTMKLALAPLNYSKDIIEQVIDKENLAIFNMDKGAIDQEEGFPLKNFNKYNMQSYTNQPIELPLCVGEAPSKKSEESESTTNLDLMSQISSQLSESSMNNFYKQSQFQQQNQQPLSTKESMMRIDYSKRAENLICLEFDLMNLPKRLRTIDQNFIESSLNLKLNGLCHGSQIFDQQLSFILSGKKIIKSIQSRFLQLKTLLAECVSKNNKYQLPEQVQNHKDRIQKFYLNKIEALNKEKSKGPWITSMKKQLIFKIIEFRGKSVAIQIKVPDLNNLPNLMTNFNQLVLQEFEMSKIFICFDLPMSQINRVQAQSINDLDQYLMTKSLQGSIEQQKNNFGSQPSSEFTSAGTPVMNLLNEFRALPEPLPLTQPEQLKNLEDEIKNVQINQITTNQAGDQSASSSQSPKNITQTSTTSHTSHGVFYQNVAPQGGQTPQFEPRIYKVPQQQNIVEYEIGNYFNLPAQHQPVPSSPLLLPQQPQILRSRQLDISNQFSKPPQQMQPQHTGLYDVSHFLKEDRRSMCNLDLFLEKSIPIGIDANWHSLEEFVRAYKRTSIQGLKIEFLDSLGVSGDNVCNFMPTLSSVYFMTQNSKVIEYHEDAPPFKRKTLSTQFEAILKQMNPNSEVDDSESSGEEDEAKKFEPISKQIMTQFSWFSILWTCQKHNFLQNVQFLVIYQFQQGGTITDIKIVGIITYKVDNETFWLTPCLLECENDLQGELFDNQVDANTMLFSDLQEKAIKFMRDEGHITSSLDFQFFLKSQHFYSNPIHQQLL